MATALANDVDRLPRGGFCSRISALFNLPSLLVAVLASVPAFLCGGRTVGTRILGEPDLWWHLRNAELLFAQKSFIVRDVYSFTTFGKAWGNPEWLAEIPYYIAFRLFRELGVFLVLLCAFDLIIVGILLLSYLRSGSWQASFVTTSAAVFLALVNFGPRTILFGWICFLAELLIMESFRRGQDYSWLLVPLFLIWINLHGSWIIGFVFLLAFVAAGFFDGKWGYIEAIKWTVVQRRRLTFVTLASAAALIVNPYGWHLILNPFDMAFHQKLNIGSIDEWKSVNFHMLPGKLLFVILAALAVLTLARRRIWALHDVLFALLAVYAGLTYVRFLFLIGLVLCPMFAVDLGSIFGRFKLQRSRPRLNALLVFALVVGVAVGFPTTAVLRRGISESLPDQAMNRIETFGSGDHIFNYYGWGGYMIWKARNHPVFIDSRTDIFEHHGVLGDYLRAVSFTNTLAIFDKYDIRYVFLPKDDPVIYLLRHTPGWSVNYEDGVAIIMERYPPHKPL
jgi:hypothetical protein